MLLRLFLLCSGLCLLTPLSSAAPGESTRPVDEELVTAVHDLSGLLPPGGDGRLRLAVLPGLQVEQWDPEDEDTSLADAIISLLIDELYADDLQYEGREATYANGPRLLLTAPAVVHATLDQLVAHVRAASRRRASVHVELLSPRSAGVDTAAMASDDIDRALAAGQLGLLVDRRIELLLGVPWSERVCQLTPVVQGWQANIAQQSAALAPEIDTLTTGTVLGLVLSSAPAGGYLLRLAARQEDLTALQRRVVELPLLTIGENGVHPLTQDLTLELHELATSTLVGATAMQPGESRVFAANTAVRGSQVGLVVRVRLESVDAAPAPVPLGGKSAALLDLSGIRWAGFEAPQLGSLALSGRLLGEDGSFGYQRLGLDHAIDFPAAELGWSELAERPFAELEWNAGRYWEQDSWMLVLAADADVARLAASLAARQPTPAPISLVWGLDDGDGRPLASGRMPLLPDAGGLAVVGRAFATLDGFEVDVANGAVAHSPRLHHEFDGLWLTARLKGGGDVELRLARNAEATRDMVELGPQSRGLFDRAVFDVAERRAQVPADGRRHELGAVDGHGARLWARVLPQ